LFFVFFFGSPHQWSLIEKESKGSISEHKIRCVYLAANAEDAQPSPNSHKSQNQSSPPINNHTNRDEDDVRFPSPLARQIYIPAYVSPSSFGDASFPGPSLQFCPESRSLGIPIPGLAT
jgi:hypothetical protein